MTGQAVGEELERVLASAIFANSPRLARLLRYIVEKSATGDRESLKEYSIGLDVFDRDPSFDPKVDSIVRSTARQLRLKLAEYYQSEGRNNAVCIRLPKGSYVAEIEERAALHESPAEDLTRRERHPEAEKIKLEKIKIGKMWFAAAAALLIAVLMSTLALNHRRVAVVRPRTLAVLPFRDLSPGQDLGYIGEGLRDGLTSALVRTKGLEVTARASAPRIASRTDPGDAAKSVQAETVVIGSVSPAADKYQDKFQVVMSLLDASTGKYLWSQTYQGKAADLAMIEHSAASSIAGALGASTDVPIPRLPRNNEALELYLRASTLARTRGVAEMRQAAKLFERVISLEPDFALGYANAASTYLVATSNGVMTWREGGPRGVELARTALALDDTLAEAHDALALGFETQWKWREANAELSRAIELDPRSPVGYFRKAVDLACFGRFAEAERTLEIARMLDPSWDAPDGLLGELYYYTRRWDDALALARRMRETRPSTVAFFDNVSYRVYIALGKFELARPFLAAHPDPYNRAWLRAIDGDPQGAWRDLLAFRRSEGASAFRLAGFAAVELQDRSAALEWLEQSLLDNEPDLVSLAIDPIFDSVRADPRAQAILRKINLVE